MPAAISVQTISITRTFQSTPEMLYRAWTEGPLLKAWSCPEDCEMIDFVTDPRVGGVWQKSHRRLDGTVHEEHGEYLELDPPRRIVQTLRNVNGFVPGQTMALQITVEFVELGPDRTEMQFTQSGGMTDDMQRGMDIGWNSCFDKLQVAIAR